MCFEDPARNLIFIILAIVVFASRSKKAAEAPFVFAFVLAGAAGLATVGLLSISCSIPAFENISSRAGFNALLTFILTVGFVKLEQLRISYKKKEK